MEPLVKAPMAPGDGREKGVHQGVGKMAMGIEIRQKKFGEDEAIQLKEGQDQKKDFIRRGGLP